MKKLLITFLSTALIVSTTHTLGFDKAASINLKNDIADFSAGVQGKITSRTLPKIAAQKAKAEANKNTSILKETDQNPKAVSATGSKLIFHVGACPDACGPDYQYVGSKVRGTKSIGGTRNYSDGSMNYYTCVCAPKDYYNKLIQKYTEQLKPKLVKE